jgi:succinate dehydrogenase / fumarate reductase flavoprotein subunit
MYTRHEMLDVVKVEGKTQGIIARNLVSGELERHFGHAVLLCTGGYGNVFYLSTNAMGSNVTAAWKA